MLNKGEKKIISYANKDSFFIKAEEVSKKTNKTIEEVKELLEAIHKKGLLDKYNDMLYYLDPYKTTCRFIDLCENYVWKKKEK